MEKDVFIDLLRRYREGRATPEERRFLEAYDRGLDLTGRKITDEMTESEREQIKAAIKEGMVAGRRPVGARKQFLGRVHHWSRIALAGVFLIFCGIWMLRYVNRASTQNAPLKVVDRTTNRANNLITLPDGSTVILSAGSTLDFPDSFAGLKTREVVLNGEAYFDVKSNPGQPFVVHSGKLKTTVLGTSFNIQARPESESIRVTVITGKVQVEDEKEVFRVLTPDEQIVYHVEQSEKEILKVDASAATSWKWDDLYCDDITVEQAIRLVEERYQVYVRITDEALKRKRFTTTFGKEESLESILNSVALFNDAVYEIGTDDRGGTTIVLSPK